MAAYREEEYMIRFKLNCERNKNAWKSFCKGDMNYIQSKDFESLLQIILEEENYDKNKMEILHVIKLCMNNFWQDPSINYPLIAKKDITHNRRIINYIERLLFPIDKSWETEQGGEIFYQSVYDLDYDDIFVLLCSVYLHDYGKGQFRLTIPHLADVDSTLCEKLKRTTNAFLLSPEDYNLIENYHTYNLSQFFDLFLNSNNENDFIRTFNNMYYNNEYKDMVLEGYRDFIKEDKETHLGNLLENGRNAGLAQKWLFRQLFKLRYLWRKPGDIRPLLKEIQIVCRSHKSYQLRNRKGGFDAPIDYFNTIAHENEPQDVKDKLSLLASLLRIGDNLDFTRERIESNALKNLMDDWIQKGAREPLDRSLLSIFAVWLKFALLEECDIRHIRKPPKSNENEYILIEIVIKYRRFTNWQKHFLTIRNKVEKDFLMTNYLSSLNQKNSVRLVLLFELVSHERKVIELANELDIKIEGKLDEIFTSMREKPDTSSEYYFYKMISPPSSILAFTPLPNDINLPTNRNLLYLLRYLEIYGPTPCNELAEMLGILDFAHLDHLKQVVERGKLLVVDENRQVRLTDDARHEVALFLEVYRDQPNLVRQKVQELEELGFLLPFSQREADTIPTGIDGLDGILNPYRSNTNSISGFKRNRNLLIVGGPGTGKTTLLLQILYWNLFHEQRNVLMLTFDEHFPIVTKTFAENFGWDINFVHSLSPFKDVKPNEILANIHSKIEKEQPDLVAIDGISRLRSFFGSEYRDLIDTFFKSLQIKGITGIFSIEEPTGIGPTEEYQADGIIHLYRHSEKRELEIEKLRSQDYIAGRHAFEILDRTYLERHCRFFPNQYSEYFPFQAGINVYPNEQQYAFVANMLASKVENAEPHYIPTGVQNLNALLPGGQEGGYRQGDSILVLGSPGAGKTLFGLHFLKAEYEHFQQENIQKSEDSPRVLWLSFEGQKELLERSVASFDPSVGYNDLLGSSGFLFYYVPPALISPEKVLYLVSNLVKQLKLKRIVVDSVSEIDEAFDESVRFRQYMTTFIHTLSCENTTSMFLYRIPGFFRSERENESEISSLVDTIICIKTFDMKNEIRRGLFVLKSRGRELRSQLQTMDIDAKKVLLYLLKVGSLKAF